MRVLLKSKPLVKIHFRYYISLSCAKIIRAVQRFKKNGFGYSSAPILRNSAHRFNINIIGRFVIPCAAVSDILPVFVYRRNMKLFIQIRRRKHRSLSVHGLLIDRSFSIVIEAFP